MISEKNTKRIEYINLERTIRNVIPYLIFFISFFISYFLDVEYNNDTSLFNDKLIDVCSIFFAVFIGSIYIFKRLNESYEDFLKFSKSLLIQNLFIIFLSLLIILFNDKLPNEINLKEHLILKPKIIIFSIYISIFNIILWNIYRFIIMINNILKDNTPLN